MLRRRIIPCLDVRDGRLVKGIKFEQLRDRGDPVDAAERYAADGADEIVWLNISAGDESWQELLRAVERAAERVDVPLCVGGGISSVVQARELLLAGADKISVNSAPLDRPELIYKLAGGSAASAWWWRSTALATATAGGCSPRAAEADRARHDRWAEESVARGAGELLMTSIDADGTLGGFDLELLSGRLPHRRGAGDRLGRGGRRRPTSSAALQAGAAAALAASIFHDGSHMIDEVKREVAACGLPVEDVSARRRRAHARASSRMPTAARC